MKVRLYLYADAFFPSFNPDIDVCVRGSIPGLGNWKENVTMMERTDEGHWTCLIETSEMYFEYKYAIVRQEPFPIVWENGGNRGIQIAKGSEIRELVIHNRWKTKSHPLCITNITSDENTTRMYFVATIPEKFKYGRMLLLGTMLSWEVEKLPKLNLERIGGSDTWMYTYAVEKGSKVDENYKFMVVEESSGLRLWELHDTNHHIDFVAEGALVIIFDHLTLVVE